MIRMTDESTHRTVSIDIPERRNALSKDVLSQLATEIRATDRPVVLTGSDGVFSAGADLNELTGTTDDLAVDAAVTAVVEAIAAAAWPVIAAIDGYCLGAAVEIAAACDVVVAAPTATFGVPATRLGLLYDPAALERLGQRVGAGALARLLLSGDRISGTEAHRLGLVDETATRPVEAAGELASRIAANDADAVRATLAVVREIRSGTFEPDDWQDERRRLLTTPSRREALDAARSR